MLPLAAADSPEDISRTWDRNLRAHYIEQGAIVPNDGRDNRGNWIARGAACLPIDDTGRASAARDVADHNAGRWADSIPGALDFITKRDVRREHR